MPIVGGPENAGLPVWWSSETGAAIVRCACGHLVHLERVTHKVDAYGNVSPEFVCPSTTCGIVAELRLGGWF